MCVDMLGGCEWSSITVIPGLLWGSGTWARYPGEGDGMGMGDASLLSLSFLHPGQRGTHLAGQGTPSPGQPPPLSDPPAGLPSASCFPSPPFVFSQVRRGWKGRGCGEEVSIFPGACFWMCLLGAR